MIVSALNLMPPTGPDARGCPGRTYQKRGECRTEIGVDFRCQYCVLQITAVIRYPFGHEDCDLRQGLNQGRTSGN
jgi:hypothetical protein